MSFGVIDRFCCFFLYVPAHHLPIAQDNLPDDFFTVLFHCQDHPHPWQALLAYCIALERPLLALLAGSYPVSHFIYSLLRNVSCIILYH